jgi:hypothetical protein
MRLSMTQHQHTALTFDCRPMKAASMDVIAQHQRGTATLDQAIEQLRQLAASLPDLDAERFSVQVGKLIVSGNHDRARKLVSALGDRTLKPWVRWAILLGWWALCAGAFVGLVAFAVWLVT